MYAACQANAPTRQSLPWAGAIHPKWDWWMSTKSTSIASTVEMHMLDGRKQKCSGLYQMCWLVIDFRE